MLHTVDLYMSLRCAARGHDGVCPSVFSGGIIDHQEVFGSLALDSVSGAHSCWNLHTVLHPEGGRSVLSLV